MTVLPDHVRRMEEEQAQLIGRLERGEAFLKTPKFEKLAGEDRDLLRNQLWHMERYSSFLAQRLERARAEAYLVSISTPIR